jgi:hypothetical protein
VRGREEPETFGGGEAVDVVEPEGVGDEGGDEGTGVAVGYCAQVAGEEEEIEATEPGIVHPVGMSVIWEGVHCGRWTVSSRDWCWQSLSRCRMCWHSPWVWRWLLVEGL